VAASTIKVAASEISTKLDVGLPALRGGGRLAIRSCTYDDGPDFRFGDVGETQFFIAERDLRARNFTRVEARMQGG
jgi:hypothetical protein